MELPENVLAPENADWYQQYPTAEEEEPEDAPEPKFKPITITTFVDADHASCTVTRRSVTGIIHFLQSTPALFYVGRQKTVESSSYGSEIVSARIAAEQIIAIRYRLRMMGTPITTSSVLLGDNRSVQTSGSQPSSQLSKKHLAIAFHKVRETVAAGILLFWWVSTIFNIADLLTKALNGQKHWSLTSYYTFGKKMDPMKGVIAMRKIIVNE